MGQDGYAALAVRHAAVALEAVAPGIHLPVSYLGDGLAVAADAVLLDDFVRCGFGANRLRNAAEGEMPHVVETGYRLDVIFGDEVGMRHVAVGAVGPRLVTGVIPALVHAVHDMAVVAGGGIIAEVGDEFRRYHADSQNDHQCDDADDE